MGVAGQNERLLARARRRLDLAACRGQWELFDSTRVRAGRHVLEQARAEALGICAQCPALAACGEWLESLPRPPAAERCCGRPPHRLQVLTSARAQRTGRGVEITGIGRRDRAAVDEIFAVSMRKCKKWRSAWGQPR